MFPSQTKPEVEICGVSLLQHVRGVRYLAIGGISPENTHTLYELGCLGIAVSSTIAKSMTPGKVTEQLIQREIQCT